MIVRLDLFKSFWDDRGESGGNMETSSLVPRPVRVI